jgi:hypothetical protein
VSRVYVCLLVFLMIFLLAGCKSAPPPVKIGHISSLKDKKEGTMVEFTGWVGGTAGDDDLGIELNMTEGTNSYPRCFVGLKDGQKDPGVNIQVCVRGLLFNKDEMNGSMLYRVNNAEIIDCY